MAWDQMRETKRLQESIFDPHEEWQYKAYIHPKVMGLYVEGYKRSADYLVDQAAHLGQQEYLVYPTMFLYRHYLEVELKHLLGLLQDYLHEPYHVPCEHDLLMLWGRVEPLLLGYWDKDASRKTRKGLKARLDEFHRIDKSSQAFRYPLGEGGRF